MPWVFKLLKTWAGISWIFLVRKGGYNWLESNVGFLSYPESILSSDVSLPIWRISRKIRKHHFLDFFVLFYPQRRTNPAFWFAFKKGNIIVGFRKGYSIVIQMHYRPPKKIKKSDWLKRVQYIPYCTGQYKLTKRFHCIVAA